jgi:hypothetical protein
MVHALETIHHLLKRHGILIDLRPTGIPAEFWGHKGESSELLGYIDETDDFIEYRQAAWAMEQAMDKGLFKLESSGQYDFIDHADSFDELRAHLAEWTDVVIPSEVIRRVSDEGFEKITQREAIHIGILSRQ